MGSDSRWRCVLVVWTLLGSIEAGWISGVCNNETASPNRGCVVTNITTDDNRFLFGVKSKGSENHIFSAAGALHFEQGTERYLGTDVVRGIRVEKWHSCQYMPVLDATVNVTWYFSDKSAWDTDIGKRSVPVRAVVVGKINDGNNVRSFNHIYDFFHFRAAINPMDLQLESGDYCQNRIKQVPFPKLPDVFSITGEMINFSEEATLTIEEHYDQKNKLNVYRYLPPDKAGTLESVNDVTEIHDFNSGIAYIINTATGVCQMRNMTQGLVQFPSIPGESDSVRQQTYTRFFLLNGTTSYSYGGVTDYQNWELSGAGQGSSYQIPILYRRWDDQDDDQPTYLYNGFSFDLDRPLTSKLDVGACFHGAQRINVRFAVDGGYKSAVTYNIENFKAALRSAVSLFLGVSQLQVADIEVYTGDPSITVTFDLLDAPPTAQDNNSPTVFNSLNNALSLLTSPSTTTYFEISVLNGQTVTTVPLLNNSGRIFFSNGTCLGCDLLYSPTFAATSSGYSAGALGGLAVAMIILGGAFGVVGGYFMFGRQGPQSGIVTLRDMKPGS
ncbi:hypothetical protein C0Q70_08958 [Pomacea canaliculata]|uniref:LolA-like domain-containing protein n=1 Tax=Pomacea canaliculata TaxID=400727 RepID=A0A2T7P8E6_POMCA|nr:hypothetical protein C0Q70_08958 [Pomacea canaliculata]